MHYCNLYYSDLEVLLALCITLCSSKNIYIILTVNIKPAIDWFSASFLYILLLSNIEGFRSIPDYHTAGALNVTFLSTVNYDSVNSMEFSTTITLLSLLSRAVSKQKHSKVSSTNKFRSIYFPPTTKLMIFFFLFN